MIWSAALPGAVLRVLRTAAGRRALHVALLVGGLFVLGLLCGGRAQAADGAPGALEDTVGRVLHVPAQTGSRPETPGPVVRAVRERVVRPVGDVVAQTVTEGLEGLEAAVQTDVPPSRLLPAPSGPIDAPDLTEMPDLGDLTDLADPIAPFAPSAPEVQDPRTEPAPRATADPADTSGAEDRSGVLGSPAVEGGGSPAPAAGYGPKPGLGTVTAAPARTHPAGIAHTEYAPAHPGPTGDPDGALGTASGADQGAPRHGDARAVAPQPRIMFRLVPGAPERADAAGVREPYRDIPVSPA
ncbi:hypothetical protein NC239_06925 [Streptomyces sp. G3]|uniref:hypothetical protein n=1 Tax=Streptomyces sp. G3 TaxID=690144 RepID=UPI00202E086F|nr:hypothetical protein [Streptomyces sp. G3]MCM1937947.1 hypothetical protein [Streptomyces sp. G3]